MTASYSVLKSDAYAKAMYELWLRSQGRSPGYWVTLNPDVEAKQQALYEEQGAVDEAINSLYVSPRFEAVLAELQRIADGIAIELDGLPAVERVFCEGPNPDPMQMMMTQMLHGSER